MVVVEAAVLGAIYGVHKYRKHKKVKRQHDNQVAVAVPQEVYAYVSDLTFTPPDSTTSLAPTTNLVPHSSQHSSLAEYDDGIPKTLGLSNSKVVETSTEWRPVYMLERSTSKNSFNEIKTHRALFVGDFYEGQGIGTTHEIRKEGSWSLFGVKMPFGRTMRYTDAEEWVGAKALDREPVLLGYTNWTDEHLNSEGHEMVDNYPTYSLTFSNCQHFVHDLAEKIIPPDKVNSIGMAKTQPTVDKLMDSIASKDHEKHSDAIVNGITGLALEASKQTTKFFHFTKAIMKSTVKLDWRPFNDYTRLIRADKLRAIAAHSREDKRRGPRYIDRSNTGSSAASISSQQL